LPWINSRDVRAAIVAGPPPRRPRRAAGRRRKRKKAGRCPALRSCAAETRRASDRLDVGRLLALRAAGHLEGDLLAFLERAETLTLDRGEMREEVLAAVVGLDEAESLRIVEPLDRTGSHDSCPRD
jgi:hypothetical protein